MVYTVPASRDLTVHTPDETTQYNDKCKSKSTKDVEATEDDGGHSRKLLYSVEDYPPVLMTVLLAFQQFAISFGGCLSASVVISGLVCVGNQPLIQAKLLNTFFVISGICTFLQSTFGVRIPTIQSSAGSFLIVVGSLMANKGPCPELESGIGINSTNITGNSTIDDPDAWRIRMREIQGAIILAGLTQAAIGFLGITGFMMRFIGPITVAVTIMSIAIQVGVDFVLPLSAKHWGIAILTTALILLFSTYLRNWNPHLPIYKRKIGCTTFPYPLQKVLAVLIGVLISWAFCGIMTATGVFSSDPNHYDYNARTDRVSSVIYDADWIYIPYPGQWGSPTFTLSGYLAMLVPTIASILESIGDYHACAKACQIPPPPVHAVNRGVFIEGIGSCLAGVYGGGGSITSYSQNSGVISITKAGSRVIFQVGALLFIIFGIFGKFGAALTALPTPIVGGTYLASVAMIFGVSLGNLSHVDIQSSRNQIVLGLSVIIGIVIPKWVKDNADMIKTGNLVFDDTLAILLQTSMFISGVLACLLDNTIPGSDYERGIASWRLKKDDSTGEAYGVYDFPYIMPWLRRQTICSYIPILPVYKVRPFCKRNPCRKTKRSVAMNTDVSMENTDITLAGV